MYYSEIESHFQALVLFLVLISFAEDVGRVPQQFYKWLSPESGTTFSKSVQSQMEKMWFDVKECSGETYRVRIVHSEDDDDDGDSS